MNDIDAYLNDFAFRSFRDTADLDYISARLAYRHQLWPQFLWSSQQAVEKYLKCILLINRVPAKNLGHSLERAVHLLQKIPFEVRLQEGSKKFIEYLDTYGRFRYFETPYDVTSVALPKLDRLVWELRRYCIVIDYTVEAEGKSTSRLSIELQTIENAEKKPGQQFKVAGKLGEIINSRNHPARQALIWSNLYFGKRNKKKISVSGNFHASNSPLSMRPWMIDAVLKYVYFPKDVAEAYRKDALLEAMPVFADAAASPQ